MHTMKLPKNPSLKEFFESVFEYFNKFNVVYKAIENQRAIPVQYLSFMLILHTFSLHQSLVK